MKNQLNATDLAAAIGKTRATIHNWVKNENLPRNKDKSFNLPAVINWMIDREIFNGQGAAAADSPALERYREARAAMVELDLKARKGELIESEEVYRQWALRVAELASGLEFLADRLPPLLVGQEREKMQSIISGEVWRLRDQYAREGKYCPPPDGAPWPDA